MKYKLNDIPYISDLYGYQNDVKNNRVICSAAGQIKVLNCIPEILQEVLSYVNGINTFFEIEKKLEKKYSLDEVKDFLDELLKERIIEKRVNKNNKENRKNGN